MKKVIMMTLLLGLSFHAAHAGLIGRTAKGTSEVVGGAAEGVGDAAGGLVDGLAAAGDGVAKGVSTIL